MIQLVPSLTIVHQVAAPDDPPIISAVAAPPVNGTTLLLALLVLNAEIFLNISSLPFQELAVGSVIVSAPL